MIRELYSERTKETTLSVVNNQVTSIQKSDTVKTGLRLYDKDNIGVAGTIGAYDENQLEDRAKQMLHFQVPYPCEPTGENRRKVDLSDSFSLTDEAFLHTSQELLSMLGREYPNFSFSHKIRYTEGEAQLKNDRGLELSHRDKLVLVELLIKHKQSKNLMDAGGIYLARNYDLQEAFRTVSRVCASFEEKVAPPEEKMPVVFLSHEGVLMKFLTDLYAHSLATGASLFSDKLGQKLFGDDFSLAVDRTPGDSYQCFFDAEGTTLPEDRFLLIENGVLKSPYTAKRVAKQYGYDLTGSAAGAYDSVPNVSPGGITVGCSGKTIKELLGGRKAICVEISAGGDFTSQGEYAAPVQAAFLFDGEKLCGRLPQIAIRSNVFDMFGKDFIGLATDGLSPQSPLKYLALDMAVDTIGDWM